MAQEMCNDQATCENVLPEALHASAMLQVKVDPSADPGVTSKTAECQIICNSMPKSRRCIEDCTVRAKVSLNQFMNFFAPPELSKEDLEALRALFSRFDEETDGLLDSSEFTTLMQNMLPHRANDFDVADVDGSGGINFDEFVRCCASIAGSPGFDARLLDEGAELLQTHDPPSNGQSSGGKQVRAKDCEVPDHLQESHFTDSRDCLLVGLQEAHLQALWRHAAIVHTGLQALQRHEDGQWPYLAEDGQWPTANQDGQWPRIEPYLAEGATAPLNASGFRDVTSLCCPWQVEVFFTRLLDSLGQDLCSKPHVQGLMHWFSCVPDMDFNFMIDVINIGSPCKYWAAKGATCPTLTPKCNRTYCR